MVPGAQEHHLPWYLYVKKDEVQHLETLSVFIWPLERYIYIPKGKGKNTRPFPSHFSGIFFLSLQDRRFPVSYIDRWKKSTVLCPSFMRYQVLPIWTNIVASYHCKTKVGEPMW